MTPRTPLPGSPSLPVTVLTGANSGIGLDAAHRLARAGGTLILLCRNEERGAPAAAAVRAASGNDDVHLEVADLASLAQVRAAGGRIATRWPKITALVNNAGLASLERRMTEDGFELTLQVNHLSHFLLTGVLRGALRAGRARVINVSSGAHRQGRLSQAPLGAILRGEERYAGLQAYADSKLANVLFTFELARREGAHGIVANALHPGMLATGIWDRNPGWAWWATRLLKPFMGRPDAGGDAVAWLVTDPKLAQVTGSYFRGREPSRPSPASLDEALAAELWTRSAEAVGLA